MMRFARAVAAGDVASASKLLTASPDLARACLGEGATRAASKEYFLDEIGHYVYQGDTALHIVAAAHRSGLVRELVAAGADVRARNRRGAEPLHYAADGNPASPSWDSKAQAATIASLIEIGADPNAIDKNGVTSLHRAVRTRCAAAVEALLKGGADVGRKNGNGSTPMQLASGNTGRGGSGSPEAKAQKEEILRLLIQYGSPS
jgi:ankyrin repeat protein